MCLCVIHNVELNKKVEEWYKTQSIYESCSNKVHKLKQEKNNKEKWENNESREEFKKKNEICSLRNRNRNLLDEVKD